MAAEVYAEQQPSTSFVPAAALEGSCFLTNGIQFMRSNQTLRASLTADCLPPEIYPKILKYLRRADIDNCSLVCKTWFAQIERNSHILAKHQIKRLHIGEEKKSFIVRLRSDTFQKQWTYKKKGVCLNDTGARKRHYDDPDADMPAVKLPTFCLYTPPDVTSSSSYSSVIPVLLLHSSPTEQRQALKKAHHTPPLDLVQRLAKSYRNADIDTVCFAEFRLTDGFVDKLAEAFDNKPIKCGRLVLRFIKLKYISVEKFARFVEMFDTKSLKLEWFRDCCGHLTSDVLQAKFRDRVQRLEIAYVTPEMPLFSDDFVIKFLSKPHVSLLRLEDCNVDDKNVVDVVKKWVQSSSLLFEKLCLTVKDLTWNDFLNGLSVFAQQSCGQCTVPHPSLPYNLRIWICNRIFYMVSESKS